LSASWSYAIGQDFNIRPTTDFGDGQLSAPKLRGFPESLFVSGECLPADEKKIAAIAFNASLKFMRDVAWHRCNDGLCYAECLFKRSRFSAADLQNRGF
jgi:hypothetical protein